MCSKTWFQPAMDPEILHAFAPDKVVVNQIKKTSSFRWILGILFFLCALIFFGTLHPQIIARFPSLALACRSLHIPIEIIGEGLEICEVASAIQQTDRGLMITLSGKIANVTNQPRDLPLLKISLIPSHEETGILTSIKDALRLSVAQRISWTHRLSQHKLLPNEEILFETDAHPIKDGEFRIDVSFEGAPK
jgi:hypothetical protein